VEKEVVQAYAVPQCERKLKVIQVDPGGIVLARASPLLRGIDKATQKATHKSTWIDQYRAQCWMAPERVLQECYRTHPSCVRTVIDFLLANPILL
jgi:hypothetical protein